MEKTFVGMSFFQKRVYPVLPVFLQNAAVSMYGLYWRQRRFGGIYQKELRAFKEREFFTAQQWRDYQTVQLRKLLVHAFETVPFYRERYGALGWTKSKFERFELEDLTRLPLLTKKDLRAFGTTSLLSTQREHGGQFYSSSGSTGTPVKILYSMPFHQRLNAAMESRVRNWAGVTGKDARGMIGGRRVLPSADDTPPFYRYNFFEKQVYFSAYHISEKSAQSYVEAMNKYGLVYMTGYAMSNYFLASFIVNNSLDAPRLKAVITSSEKLTQPMRQMFYKAYGCRTYDSYSGVENCGLISEAPNGELLISPDVGIIEVLSEDGSPVAAGKSGEAICTGLLNFDQPLIRYRMGDQLRLRGTRGSEGREMPIVEEIVGRLEDVIYTPDGRKMVRFHGVFIDLPHVLEGQVIQKTLDVFVVKVVTLSGFSTKEEGVIVERMKSQLGNNVEVAVIPVSEIPRTKNGKFRSVVSELNN